MASLHNIVALVESIRTRRIRGLGILALLNLLDIVTTIWFLALGGTEGNPILSSIVDHWWAVMLIKIALLMWLACRVLGAPARSREARWLVNLSITYYGSVIIWNLLVIVQLRR